MEHERKESGDKRNKRNGERSDRIRVLRRKWQRRREESTRRRKDLQRKGEDKGRVQE